MNTNSSRALSFLITIGLAVLLFSSDAFSINDGSFTKSACDIYEAPPSCEGRYVTQVEVSIGPI